WWRTMTELPSFKSLVSRCRCIIPADGFYERRKEGKRKVSMWVDPKTKEPFGLAGLWDVWRKPDGKRLGSFTIITTESRTRPRRSNREQLAQGAERKLVEELRVLRFAHRDRGGRRLWWPLPS